MKQSQIIIKRNDIPFFIATVILLIAAFWLYQLITPEGVGLTNDSADYLGGARAMLAGNGYVRYSGDRLPRPIVQFPPLYPLAITITAQLFRLDVFDAARVVNGFAIVANLLLIIILIRTITGKTWASLTAALMTLVSTPFLQAHVYGLSEAFASVLTFIGMILLWNTLCRENESPWLWLTIGVMMGLNGLARYAGLILTGCVVILSWINAPDRKTALHRIAQITLGFIIIFAPWTIRNRRVAESGVNRTFTFHLPSADRIKDGFRNVAAYFLPEFGGFVDRLLPVWTVVIIIILLGLSGWALVRAIKTIKSRRQPAENRISSGDKSLSGTYFFVMFMLVYLAGLITVAIFIDGSTVFDLRMLYPFFLFANLAIVSALSEAADRFPKLRKPAILIAVILVALLFEDSIDAIREYRKDGLGFAGSDWRESETAAAIPALKEGQLCFSNRRTYLGLMKNLPCYVLPVGFDAATQQVSETFTADRQWMRDEIETGNAIAVVFGYTEDLDVESSDFLYFDTLFRDLPVTGTFQDGRIIGNLEK